MQIKELKKEGCEVIFEEKFTGTKANRPGFKRLLALLQRGDTLVVDKLDRFAHNAVAGIGTVRALLARDVKVHILNMGLIGDTPTGKLILTNLSVI